MVTVLTLSGGNGVAGAGMMDTICQSYANTGGNTQQRILYPGNVFDADSIPIGVSMLDAAIEATAGDVHVLGHSMGSQAAGEWLWTYGASKAALASRVTFFLLGNPSRKLGHPPWPVNHLVRLTPDDTAFHVNDVARWSDGWANWPRGPGGDENPFNTAGYDIGLIARALIGMLTIHTMYNHIDLRNLAGTSIGSRDVGNTHYWLMA
jgi:pimeloyl-ACP methyl ester carboxylesterase